MSDDPRIVEINELIGKGKYILEHRPKDAIRNHRIGLIQFSRWVADVAQFFLDNFDQTNAYYSIFFTRVSDEKDPNVIFPSEYHVHLGITQLQGLRDYLIRHPEYSKLKKDTIEQIPPVIQESLKKFKTDYPPQKKTAFIMMRFGETDEHRKIIEAIKTTLKNNGIYGLRADDLSYHEDLYYNILTYLYGCNFGVAVFEVIEDREYNPNVAFEIGYLKALDKPVCLLKEKTLERLHTDLIGKNYNEFDMNNCQSTIDIQLSDWLFSNGFTRP